MKLNPCFLKASVIAALTVFNLDVSAQLYSNGVNTIGGNKVGIGINAPQAALHIKDYSGPIIGGGTANIPLIRFQSSDINISPVSNYHFDLRMDNSPSLSFWSFTNSNTPFRVMELRNSEVRIFNKLKVKDYGEFASGISPNGTQGYFLSLGMKEVGTSGAWSGKGATMFTSSNGDFYLMTSHTTSLINGTSNMMNNVRFYVNKNGLYVRKDPTKTAVDISFIDPHQSGSDKRSFIIRSVGMNHPSAPNTLEFWDPNNNGNAFFTMPVRIGGSYADVNILNSGYDLYVAGGIRSTKVKVDAYSNWPDFVFDQNYDLWSLKKTEDYINKNQHLPGVPSAKQVEEEGIDVAEMNAILLQKVEELTLHLIELQKQVDQLQNGK